MKKNPVGDDLIGESVNNNKIKVMMETIAQVFGMAFVCIIMICIGWTIVSYIFTSVDTPGKQNRKLLDNMNKMKNNK